MKLEIFIFDESDNTTNVIVETFNKLLIDEKEKLNYNLLSSKDIFRGEVPNKADIVFFNISNMYDVEAVKKFRAFNKLSTLIIISDSKEYGILSWSLDAIYYILKPITEDDLIKAINKGLRETKIRNYQKRINIDEGGIQDEKNK